MIIVNLLNILAILLYIMTVIRFYNNYTEFFFAMLIIIIYWTQLLISSTYIEMGAYLKDIGKFSYTTGATIRLFLMIELMLILIMFFAKRFFKLKAADESRKNNSIKNYRVVLMLLSLMYTYRFADVMILGNIFTNPYVTRFNYFSDFSTLPIAQIIDYFSYPYLWILGYLFTLEGTRKQKLYSVLLFVMNMFTVLLRGVEFGGFAINILYFLTPIIMYLSEHRKLISFQYFLGIICLLLVLVVPKLQYYSKTKIYNELDLNSAYEIFAYRALAQGADITWEIDRQIIQEDFIDPMQGINEATGLITGDAENTGVNYLMQRACPASVYYRYYLGGTAITGGYPIIWAAIFGYIGAVLPVVIDSIIFFIIVFLAIKMMRQKRYILLISLMYLYNQCYSIMVASGIHYLGNTIPRLIIFF